jgi:head-tail joining protein
MTIQFDAGNDLVEVADGLAQVTLTRPGTSDSTQVAHALRRMVKVREIKELDGHYRASDVTWHLPTSEMASPPRLGDVIIDTDGQRWTVLDARKATAGSRWRCVCRNLAVVHGLDQYVDIEKVTYTKSDGGADVPTWRAWKTGLKAKIQPIETRSAQQHDRRITAARFKIFVAEDLTVDHTHRVKGPDGTVYRITGSRRADRIDRLMEIDVVRND